MRCETESTVRPSQARRSAASTRCSVLVSRFAVISSRSSTAGFAAAAHPVRNCRNVHAADGDGSCLRRIQPQQELKNRAFARTGPADERDLLALLDGHGKIAQDGRFAVAEGDVRQHDIAACGSFAVLHGALGLGKKSVDAPDACYCRPRRRSAAERWGSRSRHRNWCPPSRRTGRLYLCCFVPHVKAKAALPGWTRRRPFRRAAPDREKRWMPGCRSMTSRSIG